MPFYGGLTPGAAAAPKRTRYSFPTSGGGTNPGQYRPRAIPETFDLNAPFQTPAGTVQNPVMEAVGAAARAPGYVYERPLAALNVLGGGGNGNKGPVDQVSDFVNSLPVVGDIARGAGNLIEGSSRLFPAAWNAPFASALKDTADMSPDTVLDPVQSLLFANLQGLAQGNKFTVGDLRAQAAQRGFTPQDIQDLRIGKRGLFDWADKSITANQVVDLAGRLVVDPLNATVILGPGKVLGAIGKVGGLGEKAEKVIGMSRARALIASTPAIRTALGGEVKGLRAGVRALQSGVWDGVSNQSLGTFLIGMSKGGGSLLADYRKVAIGTTAGQLGVNAVDFALNGNASPPPGPFADLWKLGRAIRDDTPLSNGMLYTLWAVTHFPVVSTVRSGTGPVYRAYRQRFPKFADIEAAMVDKLVPGAAKDYRSRRAQAIANIGGEDNWLYAIDMLGTKHAADGIADVEVALGPHTNTLEVQAHNAMMGDLVSTVMRLPEHQLDGRSAVRTLVDWTTGARIAANETMRKAMGGLRATFTPERFFGQFQQWVAVAKQVGELFAGAPPIAPALRQTLITEHIQVLRWQMRQIARANGGVIPAKDAAELVLRNPALLTHETGGFWARTLIRDPHDVTFAWANQRLKAAQRDSHTLREVIGTPEAWAGRRDREAANRSSLYDADGRLDLSRLDTRGSVRVYAPTADDAARRATMAPQDRLTDALAARADAGAVLDNDTMHALDAAGYPVQIKKDVITATDGGLAPGAEIALSPDTSPQLAGEVAALALERSGTRAPARLVYDEDVALRHGMTPNAFQLRWDVGGMTPAQRAATVEGINGIFDVAWVDDTAGVVYAIVPESADIAGLSGRAADTMGGIFPDRTLTGRWDGERSGVWTQTIRDTRGANRAGRSARAAGDERSVADVASHARGSTNWWAAHAEFGELDQRRLAGMAPQPGPQAAAGVGAGPRPDTEGVAFALDRQAEASAFLPNFGSPFADVQNADSLTDLMTPEELTAPDAAGRTVAALQEELFRHDPTYTLSVTPRGATPFRLGEHPFADMVIAKQAAGDALSYRIGSKVGQATHLLFGKVYSADFQREAKQELMSSLIDEAARKGATITPAEVNAFLGALSSKTKTDLLFGHQVRARGDQLDPKVINGLASATEKEYQVGGWKGFSPEAVQAIGADRFSELVSKSASRTFRRITQEKRAGSLGRAMDAVYGIGGKGMEGKTGKYLSYLRSFYPLLRFRLDPRWYLMNWFEGRIIGAVRYGARRADEVSAADARAMKAFGGGDLMDPATTGWFDDRAQMDRIMAPSFRNERVSSAQDVVEAMAADSPELAMLRRRVGDDATPRQMAEELDRMLYDYDHKGVGRTVHDEAEVTFDRHDYEALRDAGVIQRLTDINRKQWETIVNAFHGNVNRSNLERVLNSYFLYWPISYQLKVSKALFDVLTNRMLGRTTDALGAWTIDRLWKEHARRLEDDPSYRAMFEENPTLWTMAGMLLPITPFDIGWSESRITRYAQSGVGAALGLWERDAGYPTDPLDMAARVANLGLPYSIDLVERAAKELRE